MKRHDNKITETQTTYRKNDRHTKRKNERMHEINNEHKRTA